MGELVLKSEVVLDSEVESLLVVDSIPVVLVSLVQSVEVELGSVNVSVVTLVESVVESVVK